jgi:tetratricopeptide (TPR) repeat protein
MKRRLLYLAATLALASQACWADLTPDEKTSMGKLRDSQRAARSALLAFEQNISSKTASDTRPSFGEAEHAMSEVDEALVNASYFLFGAAALRDDGPRDALRAGPRSGYIVLAYENLDEAAEAIEEAEDAVTAAGALRADDAAYQLQIQRTLFFLDQASSKLAAFDRALAYANPPLPVLQYDEGFESFGQYGYDVADILISSWDALPAGADFKAFAAVVSQFWLVQNGGLDAAFRSAGVISGTAADSLDALIGGGTSGANQRLHNMMANLVILEPTVGTSVDMPRVRIKFSDCWRHMDRQAREIAR